VAVQLAGQLARQGKRVGLLDLDLCGPSLAAMLGVQGAPVVAGAGGWTPVKPPGFDGRLSVVSIALLLAAGDTAVLWRGPRKHATILSFLRDVYWSKLDFLIVDTPPGTSDEHLTVVSALRDAMDGAVLVTTPSDVARSTLGKELDFCRKLAVPVLGVVENMRGFACPCCGAVEAVFPGERDDAVERFASDCGVTYLGSVPIETAVGHGADEGRFVASAAMEAVLTRLLKALPEDDDY
jgi:Mrp family chromosome partitioning ATPase